MITFGAPSLAWIGSGQADSDSETVLPITPGNAAPSLYSFKVIVHLLFLKVIWDYL